MATKTLAFEIGTEELPAFDLHAATEQPGRPSWAAPWTPRACRTATWRRTPTPRRLIMVVRDVPEQTEATEESFRGPSAKIAFDADGNPTKAAAGFARGKGVDVDALERRDEGGTEYVYAVSAHGLAADVCGASAGAAGRRGARRALAQDAALGQPQRAVQPPGSLASGTVRRPGGPRGVRRARRGRPHVGAPLPGARPAQGGRRRRAGGRAARGVRGAERGRARGVHPRAGGARRGGHGARGRAAREDPAGSGEPGRVPHGHGGLLRRAVPGRAQGDHGGRHAGAPALLPAVQPGRHAGQQVPHHVERRPGLPGEHRGRQRARGGRPPVRRQVLLRRGPEEAARSLRGRPERGGVPGSAGHHAGQDETRREGGPPPCGAGRARRRRRGRRRARGLPVQGRPGHGRRGGVHQRPGRHGQLLCGGLGRDAPGGPGHRRPLPPPLLGRRPARLRRGQGGGHGRQAGHHLRALRHRAGAHGLVTTRSRCAARPSASCPSCSSSRACRCFPPSTWRWSAMPKRASRSTRRPCAPRWWTSS